MFKGHPKGLIAAALAKMGERFGFYTMMAIVSQFIVSKFGLDVTTTGYINSTFYSTETYIIKKNLPRTSQNKPQSVVNAAMPMMAKCCLSDSFLFFCQKNTNITVKRLKIKVLIIQYMARLQKHVLQIFVAHKRL